MRIAKGLFLLQSVHFSTLRPLASASQHAAGFAGRLVSTSAVLGVLRDQSFREVL
jgi:hypothetical protein